MKARKIKTHRTAGQHSAYLWKQFMECLRGKQYVPCTENYVSTFSTQFNLKPAEYQLGERVVVL